MRLFKIVNRDPVKTPNTLGSEDRRRPERQDRPGTRSRQDPRNGKIDPVGPDKICTTTRTTSTRENPVHPRTPRPRCDKCFIPNNKTYPRYPRMLRRTLDPETDPEPRNPKFVE